MNARALPFALLALSLGCSSNNNTGTPEAGVDAAPDVEKDVFIGTGNLVLAWTVRGMPPATGCAAAGATSVRFPANFVQFTQDTVVPCTQGEMRIPDTMASLAAITAELIDGSGTVIHSYLAEANVMANKTTTVPVRFEAPGSLRVRWTLNGGAPAPMCEGAMVMGVSFESRPVRTTRSAGCASPSAVFTNLQVGAARVVGTLISSERRAIGTAMADAEIVSGATTEVTLDFEAAVRVDP
jgi:hypothetical protein